MRAKEIDSTKRFGETLRRLRKAAGLTQERLASATGVSNSYISALEKRQKPAPPRALVASLAENLNVDVAELWNVAQAEREARLRERVYGVPTSLRIREAQPLETAGHHSPLDVARGEQELPQLIDELSRLAGSRQERNHLISLLEAILDWLREGS